MIWLALIPLAALVAFLWYPRRAPRSPFPPVTDTVAGHAQRTRGERLSEPPLTEGDRGMVRDGEGPPLYDWDRDPKDAA